MQGFNVCHVGIHFCGGPFLAGCGGKGLIPGYFVEVVFGAKN